MQNNLKIAVLLTCHNRINKTITCLESLYLAKLKPNIQLEVFLVDDGSTDGTSEAVKYKFPKINIIQGNGSLYWNRGMYLAWETAIKKDDYNYFIWLNDDVVLFKNALIDLFSASIRKPKAIISGIMRSKYEHITTYGGEDEKGQLLNPNNELQVCFKFHGNLVLIPKFVHSILGNLDPVFPHAIGDFEYALKAERSGVEKYIVPNYSGYCEKNESLPKWCLPEITLSNRFKSLYSPLGNSHPYYFFIHEKRHYGLPIAIKHFLSIHTRVLFPSLWRNQK